MIGALVGSVIGPTLCTVSLDLPFVVLAVLSALLLLVIISLYIWRTRFLSAFHSEVDEGYLLTERAQDNKISASCVRRYGLTDIKALGSEKENVAIIDDMLA